MDVADIRIETQRLILRPPQIEDFERFAQALADPEASRYIGGQQPRAAAWRKFLQMPGAWAVQGFAMFSVLDRKTGLWLGQIGPWKPDGWPGNEIGYSFHPDAWGHGYATEAGAASIDWALDNLGWNDFIHCIDPANTASQHVAQRLGSANRGPGRLPAPFEDHPIEVWGQTAQQWRQRRGAGA